MKQSFLNALNILTIFPNSYAKTTNTSAALSEDDLKAVSGRSALFYPLVGAIIGLLLCIPVVLLVNASPLILAAIITVVWASITGGLHLFGLAHCSDAWLGGMSEGKTDKEKTQQVLDTCRATTGIGVAAVISLVCILLLKFVALSVLIKGGAWLSILVAPLIGRAMILLLYQSTEFVPIGRAGNSIIDNLPRNSAGVIIITCCVVAFFVSAWGILFVLVSFWQIRRLMIKRLGGFADDTAGATVEISEMLWLLGAALFL